MVNSISNNALRALFYEVITNPKPGLVDPISQGPHPDMNVYTFVDSSLSLKNYFDQAVRIGQNTNNPDLTKMFNTLRKAGLKAEKTMFTATGGINTHKGAIFALGIFVCAESYSQTTNEDPFKTIKKMCYNLVQNDLSKTHLTTAGSLEYEKYGYGGARLEAQEGYPIVKNIALPFIKREKGSMQTRLLNTLMKIATVTIDSNLIKRANTPAVIGWMQARAQKFLDLGGYACPQGKAYLKKLDQLLTQKNYSLGGCADLLIVTVFMALERGYL